MDALSRNIASFVSAGSRADQWILKRPTLQSSGGLLRVQRGDVWMLGATSHCQTRCESCCEDTVVKKGAETSGRGGGSGDRRTRAKQVSV